MSPSYGHKDGGTLITLTGSQLNAGLTQNVLINNLNCTVIGSVIALHDALMSVCLSVYLSH